MELNNFKMNLTLLHDPVFLKGSRNCAYRDPAAHFFNDVFRVFHSRVEIINGDYYWNLGLIESRDLIHWTDLQILTPFDRNINYCGPGNIVRFIDK